MKKLISILLVIHGAATLANAQIDPIDSNGLAIGGYDPVAYFQSGKAIRGDQQYSTVSNGATYRFSTKENLQAFNRNPTKFLPQYEGYCALAVSYGKKISIDPGTFKIIDNKLYLFYNGKTKNGKVNSLETWNKNENKLLKKADELWPDVKKKSYTKGNALN